MAERFVSGFWVRDAEGMAYDVKVFQEEETLQFADGSTQQHVHGLKRACILQPEGDFPVIRRGKGKWTIRLPNGVDREVEALPELAAYPSLGWE